MRPTKYRYWNSRERKMYFQPEQGWTGFPTKLNETDKYLQFTGLLDKNGIEIYEGDIVKDIHNNIGQIKWNLFKWSLYDGDSYWEPVHHDLCKVIGNIYESPELLTS